MYFLGVSPSSWLPGRLAAAPQDDVTKPRIRSYLFSEHEAPLRVFRSLTAAVVVLAEALALSKLNAAGGTKSSAN